MKYIIAAVLSAILLQLSPTHFNKSETVAANSRSTVSVKQPPTNRSEHLTKPVGSDVTTTESAKPQEQETITNSPEDTAKATLNDLGQSDAWYAVRYIAFKESSWNPAAINSIGACGLFQALPCSKLPCSLEDVPCQVRWATNYATQRYGSWHYAYVFWVNHGWW